MAKTVIKPYKITVEFDDLADAWAFCDKNGLPRCERLYEKELHPYQKGPHEWANKLQFWHNPEPGKIKYSKEAIEYYDNWLADIFKNERVATKLQTGLQ